MCGRARPATVSAMTETLHGPPPADLPPTTVRLVRDPDDKVVAGVCAGLGRTTGTDPVLWRVTLAVLVLFGGVGLVLYVLAWVLIPRAGAPESAVERVVRGQGVPRAAAVLLGGLAVLAVLAVAGDNDAPLVLLALLGLGWLVVRERRLDRASAGGEVPAPGVSMTKETTTPTGWPQPAPSYTAPQAYVPSSAPLYDERVPTARSGCPDVLTLQQAEAEQAITDAKFTPVVVESSNTTEPAGTVIQQIPEAGEELSEGQQVTIVVSTYVEPTDLPTDPTDPTDLPPDPEDTGFPAARATGRPRVAGRLSRSVRRS